MSAQWTRIVADAVRVDVVGTSARAGSGIYRGGDRLLGCSTSRSVTCTGLIVDAGVLAGIDEMLARKAPQWNKLSREKVAQLVDWLVVDVDPEAVRVARQCDVDRHIVVEPDQNGMAEIWGSVRALDAAVFDRRLDQRASTVCRDDPRTQRQRRADALAPADQTAAPQPLQTAPPTRSSFMCWPRRARSRARAPRRAFCPVTAHCPPKR